MVYTHCQSTKEGMARLVQNAVEMGWADEDTKKEILKELEEVIASMA